jgi:hypothetical protein
MNYNFEKNICAGLVNTGGADLDEMGKSSLNH